MVDLGDAKLQVSVEGVGAANAKLAGLGRSAKQMGGQVNKAGMVTQNSFMRMNTSLKTNEAAWQQNYGAISAWSQKAGIAIAAVGAAITVVLAKTVLMASDVEEMTAKFDVVFGESAEATKAWADEFGTLAKRSKFDLMEMASTIQDTFVPMGFARDEAAGLSRDITTLAVDVASFNNKLDANVMRDFQSALVGNHETVRKYGIVITEATISQELMNMGIKGGNKEATNAQKVQARLNLLYAGTIDAQGDAIRTSDSFANSMKGLKAAIKDVSVMIGTALLPIVTPLVNKIGEVFTAMAKWMQAHPGLTKVLIILAGALGVFMLALGALMILLPTILGPLAMIAGAGGLAGLSVAFGGAGAAIMAALGPIALIIAAILILAGLAYLVISNWEGIQAFFVRIWGGIQSTVSSVVDWFKGLPSVIGDIFGKIGDFMLAPIRNAVNGIIEALNWMIEQYNKLPWGDIGEIGWRFPELSGGAPTADTGGVFRGPGAVKIGDLDEIMIPAGKGGMGNTYNIEINTDVLEASEQSARRWANIMLGYINEKTTS